MRLLLQRVTRAEVRSEGEVLGSIDTGLLVLAGFGKDDGPDLPGSRAWTTLLNKVVDLRIFPDAEGRFNLSLKDIAGDLLLVSQFTLYADCRRGRRPSFSDAAEPESASRLFDRLVRDLMPLAPGQMATGSFGADMLLDFVNWGPVTILLDSADFA
ncbi:MAG TPA: D-aminoacyl-tRNA deacylase [Desulfovibrio sp.]|jgi:D-tyrosyl-tRNA(Tyr) deacylase|uniref:D-aminoacyl-tRNA deacylase n=1 Tax=Desulfovibrio sp. TaxID=885 RepID=UPI002C8830F8|nr:D-aminoacyl-tRNA deacylase [Desulfovibrio sp.]HMM39664.1 D-aminoacyl-tRNA deacylase [Desulfovibrio sp.]